jgi:pimeloyl-ACP methyl ester carboxylesterase
MKSLPQTVRVGKIDMEYHVADFTDPWAPTEPETILFHAGFCRNMELWRSWVPTLSRRYRVVRFNSRGNGATDAGSPEDEYNSAVLVADALGLLDALGIDKVHWVGESSGGAFGLAAALDAPQRIRSLVLVNTPLQFSKKTSELYNVGQDDLVSGLKKHGVEQYVRETLGNRLDLQNASKAVQEWYIREAGKVPLHVAVGHAHLTLDIDFRDRLDALKLPILNLAGDKSAVASKTQMEEMARMLPNMKLVLFEGFGHGINVLIPDRCVAEVLAFLASLPPDRAP